MDDLGPVERLRLAIDAHADTAQRILDLAESFVDDRSTAEVSLAKAWKADRSGNLIFRRTARNFNPAVVMAGRISVVEVEEIVDTGTFDPDAVHLPGIYVHRLVLNATPEKRIEKRTTKQNPKG